MTERLKEAQEAKARTFSLSGEHSLGMSFSQAAMAFGIRKQRFLEMARSGRSLLLEPRGDWVRISLVASAGERQKEIWDEIITSFRRKNEKTYLTKKAYVNLYAQIQRGLPEDLEDDIGLLHLALYALWDRLSEGTQRSLYSMSPGQVRSSMGIVRGGE